MGRDCKVDKRRKEKKMSWLDWNGSKKQNAFKARCQALRIMQNSGLMSYDLFEDFCFFEKLFNEILRFCSPSIINSKEKNLER